MWLSAKIMVSSADKPCFNIIESLSRVTTQRFNQLTEKVLAGKPEDQNRVDLIVKECLALLPGEQRLSTDMNNRLVQRLLMDWKTYFLAKSDYSRQPEKYYQRPAQPKSKKSKCEISVTRKSLLVSREGLLVTLPDLFRKTFGMRWLTFSLAPFVKAGVTLENLRNVQFVRMRWHPSKCVWIVSFCYCIYPNPERFRKIITKFPNIMSVDLGLNNLAAVTFMQSTDSYLVDGRRLKSVNTFVNREISEAQRLISRQSENRKRFRTKKTLRLRTYREDRMDDYLHKVSRILVSLAVSHRCHTILFGCLKGIKQGNRLRNFVQVPVERVVQLVKYKAELSGLSCRTLDERYTSCCDALNLDPVDRLHYRPQNRITRGLYQSQTGLRVNADINGSLNILRLFRPNRIPELISSARVRGQLDSPVKIYVS